MREGEARASGINKAYPSFRDWTDLASQVRDALAHVEDSGLDAELGSSTGSDECQQRERAPVRPLHLSRYHSHPRSSMEGNLEHH